MMSLLKIMSVKAHVKTRKTLQTFNTRLFRSRSFVNACAYVAQHNNVKTKEKILQGGRIRRSKSCTDVSIVSINYDTGYVFNSNGFMGLNLDNIDILLQENVTSEADRNSLTSSGISNTTDSSINSRSASINTSLSTSQSPSITNSPSSSRRNSISQRSIKSFRGRKNMHSRNGSLLNSVLEFKIKNNSLLLDKQSDLIHEIKIIKEKTISNNNNCKNLIHKRHISEDFYHKCENSKEESIKSKNSKDDLHVFKFDDIESIQPDLNNLNNLPLEIKKSTDTIKGKLSHKKSLSVS